MVLPKPPLSLAASILSPAVLCSIQHSRNNGLESVARTLSLLRSNRYVYVRQTPAHYFSNALTGSSPSANLLNSVCPGLIPSLRAINFPFSSLTRTNPRSRILSGLAFSSRRCRNVSFTAVAIHRVSHCPLGPSFQRLQIGEGDS